jgi:hypothetical protein
MAMASRHLATCLAAYVLLASALSPLAAGDYQGKFCDTSSNFTQNDTYQANIQSLADTLPKNASASRALFATASLGSVPNIVYALALCRGDHNASECESCVAGAFTDAQQRCAYNKGATIFYDHCLLRYANTKDFLNSNSNGNQLLTLRNMHNVTVPFKVFDAAVAVLVNATADYAANSSRRFGTGVEGFQNIDSQKPMLYGQAQCTPDMSPADCRSCLGKIIQSRPQYFSGRQGGRIVGVRCNYRYEQYSFFANTPLLQLPEPAAGGGEFGELIKVVVLHFLRSIRSVQGLNFATRGGEKVRLTELF